MEDEIPNFLMQTLSCHRGLEDSKQSCTLDKFTLALVNLEYAVLSLHYRLFAAYYTENRPDDPVTSCPLYIKRVFNPQHFTSTCNVYNKHLKPVHWAPFPYLFFTNSSSQLYLMCQLHHPPDSKQVLSQFSDLIHFPVKRLRHTFKCLGLFLDCTRDMWGGKQLVYFLHNLIISVSRKTTLV